MNNATKELISFLNSHLSLNPQADQPPASVEETLLAIEKLGEGQVLNQIAPF
jgi:hypothetical protein